jgi:excisionase family DNA binding protein
MTGDELREIARRQNEADGLGPTTDPSVLRMVALHRRVARAAAGQGKGARPVTPEVLTVAEVSQILQVSRNHVYELVRSGKIHTLRIGSAIRMPRTALDAFIRQVPEPVEAPDAGRETTDAETLAEAAHDLRATKAATYMRAQVGRASGGSIANRPSP